MLKNEKRRYFGVLLVAIGILATANVMYLKSQTETVGVYVAATEIPINRQIQKSDFRLAQYPTSVVPTDRISNVDDYVGKYPKTVILPEQPVLKAMFNEEGGTSIKSMVKNVGDDYALITALIDPTDFPLDLLRVGDTVNLLGKRKEGDMFVRDRTIINAKVMMVKKEENKLLVAVPRSQTLHMVSTMDNGAFRVEIDTNEK